MCCPIITFLFLFVWWSHLQTWVSIACKHFEIFLPFLSAFFVYGVEDEFDKFHEFHFDMWDANELCLELPFPITENYIQRQLISIFPRNRQNKVVQPYKYYSVERKIYEPKRPYLKSGQLCIGIILRLVQKNFPNFHPLLVWLGIKKLKSIWIALPHQEWNLQIGYSFSKIT